MTVTIVLHINVFFSQMGQQHLQQETKNSAAAAGKEKGLMTQRYVKGIIKYLLGVSSYFHQEKTNHLYLNKYTHTYSSPCEPDMID